MVLDNLTDHELVRHVDNTPDATPLERMLANRLDAAAQRIDMLNASLKSTNRDPDDML